MSEMDKSCADDQGRESYATLNRSDMITELASDMTYSMYEMSCYEEFHAWLQPILIMWLNQAFPDDDSLTAYYEAQLGKETEAASDSKPPASLARETR